MAGEGRLHRVGGGLQVADLADHDDVRVLAEDVAQDGGEGHLDLRLHRDLVELLVHHLHRVLHGDDVLLRGGDLLEGGIEGGGLAAAGGTGDQHDAVGRGHEAVVDHPVAAGEAEVVEPLEQHLRVEDAHHRLLAEGHRHGGHADLRGPVLLAPADLDAAVLGPPLLGDVHPGQALDARGDGRVHRLGQVVDGVEHAVDAEADQAHVALGFDVDVARPLLQGVAEQVVDRGLDVLVRAAQFLGRGQPHVLLEVADVHRRGRTDRAELALGGGDRTLEAEELGEDLADVGLGGQVGPYRHLVGPLDVLERVLVVRVVGDHLEQAVVQADGQDQVPDRERARDGLGDHVHVQFERVELLERDVEAAAHRQHDHFLADRLGRPVGGLQAEREDDVHQVGEPLGLAVLVLLAAAVVFQELQPLLGLVEEDELPLGGGEQPLPHEQVEQVVAVEVGHGRLGVGVSDGIADIVPPAGRVGKVFCRGATGWPCPGDARLLGERRERARGDGQFGQP